MEARTNAGVSFLLLFFALHAPAHAADQAPSRMALGFILPLTGETANAGAACQNGVALALDELSSPQRDSLRITYEDDANTAAKTVSGFAKLTAEHQADVLVTMFSNTSKAVTPIAEAKGIPQIAIATDPEIPRGRPHVFNLWVTPENQVAALIDVLRCRGLKRIALVSTVQQGLLAYKKLFLSTATDFTVVADEEFLMDARDFRTYLRRLKSSGDIDAVFTNLYFGQVGLFAKQAREQKINVPLFAIETFEDPEEVKSSGGALIGQFYAQADDPSGEFQAAYKKRFPDASIYTAANCHDVVLLAAAANAKGIMPRDLHIFLGALKDFNGALGHYSATGDNRFSLPAAIKVVTPGGFERTSGEKRSCAQ